MASDKVPRVSIVTPAFNQAKFLPETIESVLAQDYPSLEYIVIDDGSTDGTEEILKRYSNRIVTLTQPNMGQARTLNKGWAVASGQYIGYLSSDDILYPGAITALVNYLEVNPTSVCVYPDADTIDLDSRIMKKNVCRPFDYEHLVVSQECFIGPGALFRKSAYEQVGGWREDLSRTPDREFWMRLGTLGEISLLPNRLAGYRLHAESTSFREDKPDGSLEYVRVTIDFFAAENVPESLKARQCEAMGYAYLVVARTCFRAGEIRRGLDAFRTACTYNPAIKTPRVILRHARSIVGRPIRRLVWQLRKALP
jgi:glycosyltransferase involved in cell wall biosynthesis